jgi:hypothetical protein
MLLAHLFGRDRTHPLVWLCCCEQAWMAIQHFPQPRCTRFLLPCSHALRLKDCSSHVRPVTRMLNVH